jgi:hypothetical protein
LDQGLEVPEVGRRMGILANNLHKAIRSGRLRRPKKKIHPARQAQAPRPIFDSSKNESLALKDLCNVKSVLALHFPVWMLSVEFAQSRRYRHARDADRLRSVRRKLAAE